MESITDKYSIKNLLFSKAIPNYKIPVPVNGHKVFSCTDCGDKFLLESSLEYHVNRKSVEISYMCRNCNELKVFYNRCNLLCHIRSHAFKTATINVTDLKVEPLPMSLLCNTDNDLISGPSTSNQPPISQIENAQGQKKKFMASTCFECKENITDTGIIYKDRAKHYMQYSKSFLSCPICMVTLPTNCAMKAHLRIHLKSSPYYCPECGVSLSNKSVVYPYNHDCEGFKMMRATARIKCVVPECHLVHPNDLKSHLKSNHLKKVLKCPFCFVACFNEVIMTKHLKTHNSESGSKASIFYQCEMCPGRLVLQTQIENHIKTHLNGCSNLYPCWSCGTICKDVPYLIEHHINNHGFPRSFVTVASDCDKIKRVYRVVKRCDQCKRSFTYKCKYDQIKMLPTECPYKCSTTAGNHSTEDKDPIICHLCKQKISQKWENVTKHYAENHPVHRCINIKVLLTRLDTTQLKDLKTSSNKNHAYPAEQKKKSKKKRNLRTLKIIDSSYSTRRLANNGGTERLEANNGGAEGLDYHCSKCNYECESKEYLEKHMVQHRDPCMAYQCMECGKSFVVKPSFSKHLLLEHGISDVQEYIKSKQCYNESAFLKYQYGSLNNEPLNENQCNICREQFDCSDDLEKHFRVHGMAFLMKNNSIKNISP